MRIYLDPMKINLVTKTTLLASLGTALLTGCATNSEIATGGPSPASTLSFSPVTDAKDLVKWDGKFRQNLRSIDTYVLAAPAAVDMNTAEANNLPTFSESLPPGSVFVEAAGAEPQPYRVILHRPNQR